MKQESERGFLEDALKQTKLMRVRFLQARCMEDLALSAYTQGNLTVSQNAAAAAIDTGKSRGAAPDLFFFEPQRVLLELANLWFEGGYASAALKERLADKELLESDTSENQYQGCWRDLGEAAAEQGDLRMAAETLGHLSAADDRARVMNAMKGAQATITSPEQALQIAEKIDARGRRFEVLRKIAQRQIEAGDKAGAAHALQMAMEIAKDEEEFRVILMADIAWEQIRMGDKARAEATIAEALKDNETVRWGSDQVNGWMMLAEDLAFMGEYDRALAVARKNEHDGSRARTLQLIAYRETQAGHGDWAMAWGQRVEDPEGRARTLVGIAAGLIEKITGKDEDIYQY